MSEAPRRATIEKDGWTLVSAEGRQAAHPDTFVIPSRDRRASLSPGDGAKLLFDIETKENGLVTDRGIDRMWVIVKNRRADDYIGILDSIPGAAENLKLARAAWCCQRVLPHRAALLAIQRLVPRRVAISV